jgi:hypothetical protein
MQAIHTVNTTHGVVPVGYPEFSSYKRRHLEFVDASVHNKRTAVKAGPCVGMELHDCGREWTQLRHLA